MYHQHIRKFTHKKYKAYFFRKKVEKEKQEEAEKINKDKKNLERDYLIDYSLEGTNTNDTGFGSNLGWNEE